MLYYYLPLQTNNLCVRQEKALHVIFLMLDCSSFLEKIEKLNIFKLSFLINLFAYRCYGSMWFFPGSDLPNCPDAEPVLNKFKGTIIRKVCEIMIRDVSFGLN
jgi:hypothetical protein